ncbi:MAG: hypothetical protein JNK02_03585 [Planctomycetes bacterium]|nr:hypothetical protein [Planctomycetota bacterium]
MSEREVDLVPEAELVELFQRRRPDPAAFRARVAQRVAEREREPATEGADRRSLLRTEFLRRAAAFLPLDPTSGSSTAKLALTGLALPLAVLVASVAAFAAASRAIVRTSRGAAPARTDLVPFGWTTPPHGIRLRFSGVLIQLLQPLGMYALLLPGIYGSRWALDVVVALALCAGLALVFLVRALADAVRLTPSSVADFTVGVLISLFAGAFVWPAARDAAGSGSDLGIGWSAGVLLAGIALATFWPPRRVGWYPGFALAFVPAILVLNPIGATFHQAAALRDEVATLDLDAGDLRGWDEFGTVARTLRALGEPQADLARADREIARALEGSFRVHPAVWTAASEAGLMDEARWRTLAAGRLETYALDRLLADTQPLRLASYELYRVRMLLATRAVGPEQRAALAARIEAGWPTVGVHDALADALVRVRVLDELGLAQRADARRDEVHRLLREHWIPSDAEGRFSTKGGFTPDPRKFATSLSGPTVAGVELMARFGAPEGLDARAVRDRLRADGRAHWLLFPRAAGLQVRPRAALLLLEREVGFPPRSWLASILAERVLVACVLLVLLCVVAIRSAPRQRPAEIASAGP